MVQSFMDMILIQQIRNWAIDTMAITNILGVCALKYVGIIKRIQVLKMKIYHEN